MAEYNPFLNDEDEEKEEKVYFKKPIKKETLTEAQKERNFKGLKMVGDAIRKAKPFRGSYEITKKID